MSYYLEEGYTAARVARHRMIKHEQYHKDKCGLKRCKTKQKCKRIGAEEPDIIPKGKIGECEAHWVQYQCLLQYGGSQGPSAGLPIKMRARDSYFCNTTTQPGNPNRR